jgi:hypothetical protein
VDAEAADEEERPAPRPRRREEEDEEDDRPRRRSRPRPRRSREDRETVTPSMTPLLLALLGCFCSCAPIIGFGLGYYAVQQADMERDRLPGSKRYAGARAMMTTAKVCGFIAMGLSVVLLIVAFLLNVFVPIR